MLQQFLSKGNTKQDRNTRNRRFPSPQRVLDPKE